jgi:phage FluMu protein Com
VHIRCPNCNASLAKSQAGRLKVRLPILSFRRTDGDGGHVCETVCPACKADVPLPLSIADEGLVKSLAPPSAAPPFGLRLSLRAESLTQVPRAE